MALAQRTICRLLGFNYGKRIIADVLSKSSITSINRQDKRFLFSLESIGYEGYHRQKSLVAEQVGDAKVKFFERIESYLNESEKNHIFTEDLKVAVFLAENNKDIELIVNLIQRYHKINSGYTVSTFIFGPIVMRLLHIQNKPDVAISIFNDPAMDKFFDQFSSFFVYMDLLYRNQRYTEVIEALDKLAEKSIGGMKYTVDCVTLACAACYKLNTPEHLLRAVGYLEDCKDIGQDLSMRSITYVAMLAYNQKNPIMALEVLSRTSLQQDLKLPVAYLNIKLLILTECLKLEEAVGVLKMIVQDTSPYGGRRDVFQEVLDKLIDKLKENTNKTLLAVVEKIAIDLKNSSRLIPFSFVEYMDSEIQKIKKIQSGYKHKDKAYNDIGDNSTRGRERPGLYIDH